MRVFLIGFMGSGKSVVGKILAGKLGYSFIDLDNAITGQQRMTIASIFSERGEKGFRMIEQQALAGFLKEDNFVMACGGGTPCFFDNLQRMNDNGKTVFLNTDPEVLFSRLKTEKDQRPLLKNLKEENLRDFINVNLDNRKKFYSLAAYSVNSSSDPESIAQQIFELIK